MWSMYMPIEAPNFQKKKEGLGIKEPVVLLGKEKEVLLIVMEVFINQGESEAKLSFCLNAISICMLYLTHQHTPSRL